MRRGITIGRKVCPECRGNIFEYDMIHAELCCCQCGLVLIAPYAPGLVFPGYAVPQVNFNLRLRISFYDNVIFLSIKSILK